MTEQSTKICHNLSCMISCDNSIICKKCKISYCSDRCQQLDLTSHKQHCLVLINGSEWKLYMNVISKILEKSLLALVADARSFSKQFGIEFNNLILYLKLDHLKSPMTSNRFIKEFYSKPIKFEYGRLQANEKFYNYRRAIIAANNKHLFVINVYYSDYHIFTNWLTADPNKYPTDVGDVEVPNNLKCVAKASSDKEDAKIHYQNSKVCQNAVCRLSVLPDGQSFKLCGNCKVVNYCSKQCQISDWPQHKKSCSEMGDKQQRKYFNLAVVRLLPIISDSLIAYAIDKHRNQKIDYNNMVLYVKLNESKINVSSIAEFVKEFHQIFLKSDLKLAVGTLDDEEARQVIKGLNDSSAFMVDFIYDDLISISQFFSADRLSII